MFDHNTSRAAPYWLRRYVCRYLATEDRYSPPCFDEQFDLALSFAFALHARTVSQHFGDIVVGKSARSACSFPAHFLMTHASTQRFAFVVVLIASATTVAHADTCSGTGSAGCEKVNALILYYRVVYIYLVQVQSGTCTCKVILGNTREFYGNGNVLL